MEGFWEKARAASSDCLVAFENDEEVRSVHTAKHNEPARESTRKFLMHTALDKRKNPPLKAHRAPLKGPCLRSSSSRPVQEG